MLEAVESLNRDTIARNNGIKTDNSSMNHFCSLILKYKIEDEDAYRNRLEIISAYDGLSSELKNTVDTLKAKYTSIVNRLAQEE